MRKLLLWAFAVIGLIIGIIIYRTLVVAGTFEKLEEKLTASCERIPVAPGAEDITIDHEKNIGFVSAMDRRTYFSGAPLPRGSLWVFDLADPAGTMREVGVTAPKNFNPHGIGLYKGEAGDRLFVVNHLSDVIHFIEIFDVAEDGELTHTDSIRDPAIYSPNDVIGVGRRQFYATNDQGTSTGFRATLETNLMVPNTNAVFYDGDTAREVVGPLNNANGINVSPDGKTIYIAEVTGRRIGVYRRDRITNDLTHLKHLRLNTLPDNIEIGADGLLYTGGHTRIFDYLKFAKDETHPAVSHIVRVDPKTGARDDVLINLDNSFPAATVGAATHDRIFIGSVFERDILSCPLN